MKAKWITAAAAAGALSSAAVAQGAPRYDRGAFVESGTREVPYAGAGSERARILGIAGEVRRLFARYTDTDPRAILAPRTLEDLGVDEVALADVVLGLEARFDVDIADEEASEWRTVGEVVGFVAKRVRETRSA